MAKSKGGWKNPKAKENGRKGGRPIGSISEETKARNEFKREYVAMIKTKAKELFEAQFDLAVGHFEEKEDALGNVKVYKRRPDNFTLTAMIDQMIGRAPQKIELEAEVDTNSKPMSKDELDIIAQGIAMAMPDYAEQNKKDIDAAGSH